MATIPQVRPKKAQVIEEAASKIAGILGEHFDEQGWSEEERKRRVSDATARVAAAVAGHAKSGRRDSNARARVSVAVARRAKSA